MYISYWYLTTSKSVNTSFVCNNTAIPPVVQITIIFYFHLCINVYQNEILCRRRFSTHSLPLLYNSLSSFKIDYWSLFDLPSPPRLSSLSLSAHACKITLPGESSITIIASYLLTTRTADHYTHTYTYFISPVHTLYRLDMTYHIVHHYNSI